MAKPTKADLTKMNEELRADNRLLKDVVQGLIAAPPPMQFVPMPGPTVVVPPAADLMVPYVYPLGPSILLSDPIAFNNAGCAAVPFSAGPWMGTFETRLGVVPDPIRTYS